MRFRLNRRRNKKSNPFVAIIMGIGLFLGSFIVLYLNEGRVDLSRIARESVSVDATAVDSTSDGKLVAATGTLRSDSAVTDAALLASGDFLSISRSVEMYAWDETSESNDDGPTRYTYSKEWTNKPEDSSRFRGNNNYYNPPMKFSDETFKASSLTLDAYTLSSKNLFFRGQEPLNLEPSMLREGRIDGDYHYIGSGSIADPTVGDLRIQYTAFANNQRVTVFGQQDGAELRPYTHRDDTILFRAYPGDRESAIATMRSEFLAMIWGFRGGGFVMMWIGMMLIISPLTNILGRVPVLGNAGNAVIGAVAFVIALVLSAVTIVISAILHNPIALAIIFLLIVGAGVLIWRQQRSEGKVATV